MLPSRMSDGLRCLGDFTNGWPEGFFQETFNYGAQCAEQDAVQNCPVLATSLTTADLATPKASSSTRWASPIFYRSQFAHTILI